MDKKADVTEEKVSSTEFISHTISFMIKANKNDDDGIWETTIDFSITASRDGENSGTLETSVKSFDSSVDNALATAMLYLANFVSDDGFNQKLLDKVIEAENL